MDWITDDLAIGNYLDARNRNLLTDERIQSVICLDGNLRGRSPEDLGVQRIDVYRLEDGPGNDSGLFLRILGVLETLLAEYKPVLVSCHAGQSRSAVLVTAHLMRSHALGIDEAVERIRQKRPQIDIQPGLLSLLAFVH